jgi:hypothetical protein
LQTFFAENTHFGFGDLDAMYKRGAYQIGIDQGGNCSEFIEGNKRGQEFDAVFHNEAYCIASDQTLRAQGT